MVKKAIALGFILVTLFVLCVPTGAQESDLVPQYAVAFNTTQGVHVASLMSNETWRIDTLPKGVFLGQFDVMNCVPVWSSDGHRAYVMVEPEISDPDDYNTIILSQVGVYDITTQTFEILADVLDAEAILSEKSSIYTGYTIASLSPDERYVWLNSTLSGDSLLVDLQTGETLYQQPYEVRATAWSPDAVFVGAVGIMFHMGEYDGFVLSLPDGERLVTVPPIEGAETPYGYRAFWLPENNSFVFSMYADLAAAEQVMGMIDAATWTVDYFDEGRELQAAPSREYVSYVNMAGELIVMDLKRGQQDTLGLAGTYIGWHSAADELVNITVAGEDEVYDIVLTNYDYAGDPEPKESVIAEGVPYVDRILVSPDIERVMLHFFGDGVALYHGEGELITGYEINTPDGPAQLKDYDLNMMWGKHYTYFNRQPPVAANPQSLAINDGGEVIFPPDGYEFVGEAPDGRWQLLLGSPEDIGASVTTYHELVAYSEHTQETVTFFAYPEDIVYLMAHGWLSEAFVWSPLLAD